MEESGCEDLYQMVGQHIEVNVLWLVQPSLEHWVVAELEVVVALLKGIQNDQARGIDVVLESTDSIKDEPAKLHSMDFQQNLKNVIPGEVLHQTPHDDAMVAVNSLCDRKSSSKMVSSKKNM
jgi:hypothetical protein